MLGYTCSHLLKKCLMSNSTILGTDNMPSQSITQVNGSICCWCGFTTSSPRHRAAMHQHTLQCTLLKQPFLNYLVSKEQIKIINIVHKTYLKIKKINPKEIFPSWLQDTPNLGTMFLTIKPSQAPGVKTSFQGCRMSRAEASLGCQRCRAFASLLRIGGYNGSRRFCIWGNHGWIHEWMGTVSVSGFQLST